ncbi:class I SAM-dependent RNA methyltransferase [Dactylosporangium sp. AC04546]|uniref:class I SAM-dependent RNA methyltransferase n=1 Tax=Dactylosporangium sp. AC04546 TaxID=2862460 RepID=UPI001EE0A4E9|nr:class I SAM-dependent RNA methyltransferase [Dactylosporangium sp. AC04546]WVK85419.1 class I SAM-dependent RNA methyltransferase [Dactylosporangium sp. AC04546]
MTLIELEVGPVAHGGHCVARHEGQVVFVRHALPGERVLARVTDERKGFLRADAVEVLLPSPDRVIPPCPFAGPDACGGCDWQHADPAAQRRLKEQVLAEQLARLAGITATVPVEPLPGGPLGWRTRVQYAVAPDGRPGFHKHRSSEVLPVDRCRIAHPSVQALPVLATSWPPGSSVEAVVSSEGDTAVVPRASRAGAVSAPKVRESLGSFTWNLDATSFWQVHPQAAAAFTATVLDMLAPTETDRVWDLYGGAGVFASVLAPHCGPVTVVESDRRAVSTGQRALRDLPNVRFTRGDVAAVLSNPRWRAVDLVVLDPPRSGAGKAVVESIAARSPRAVAYVACDPAAFARDVRTFADRGYELARMRAFDSFPMTHHFETIGLLLPR